MKFTLSKEIDYLISKLEIVPLKTRIIKNMTYVLYEDIENVRLLSLFKYGGELW